MFDLIYFKLNILVDWSIKFFFLEFRIYSILNKLDAYDELITDLRYEFLKYLKKVIIICVVYIFLCLPWMNYKQTITLSIKKWINLTLSVT